jgi:hypothetical protein
MYLLKKLFGLVFAIAAFGAAYYIYTKGPCDSPLQYTIGSFDTKFGVSRADFIQYVKEAETVWEGPLKRQFFSYDSAKGMPINLMYDTRQAMVDKNKVLTSKVNSTSASANQVKEEYSALMQEHARSQATYQSILDQYNAALSDYNSKVSYWNARGGATGEEYDKMMKRKATLDSLRFQVEGKREEANALAGRVNALVSQYNYLVSLTNSDIDKINESANKEFEQGEYIYDEKGARINVYEFEDKATLIRLLAHEMGHALGLGHNSNPKSIMYYLNEGTGTTLSSDDVTDLKKACKIKDAA